MGIEYSAAIVVGLHVSEFGDELEALRDEDVLEQFCHYYDGSDDAIY